MSEIACVACRMSPGFHHYHHRKTKTKKSTPQTLNSGTGCKACLLSPGFHKYHRSKAAVPLFGEEITVRGTKSRTVVEQEE